MRACWLRVHSAARLVRIAAFSSALGAAPLIAQSAPQSKSTPAGMPAPAQGPQVAPLTGDVGSRGVIILRAKPKPPEAVAPQPEPAPTHTPATVPAIVPAPASSVEPSPEPAMLPAPSPTPHPAPAAVVPSSLPSCSRPFAKPALVLSAAAQQGGDAARDFNRALRRKLLQRRGPVIVDLAEPFAADKSSPAALAPWLGRIKSSGGAVRTVQYCEQSRGLFGMFRRAFSSDSPADYAAADSYDAVQHVYGLDQTVTQIEFRLRETAK